VERRVTTLPAAPDDALVQRLLERDRSAAEILYSRFAGRLYALGYRLTGRHERAVRFAADAFARAFSGLDEIEREGLDLATYFVVVAKGLFLEEAESTGRREPLAKRGEPRRFADDSERGATTRRQHDVLRLASVSLPRAQRLDLALRELELLSYAEIASLVDASEAEVARTIAAARERLRVQLGLTEPDRSHLPGVCRRVLPLLSAHLDGELTAAKHEGALAHLGECERCQAELDDLEEVQRRYRAYIPPAPTPELIEHI
jgi:RNA polymerase sigma-70 factor (ECF subfamily)